MPRSASEFVPTITKYYAIITYDKQPLLCRHLCGRKSHNVPLFIEGLCAGHPHM